MDEIVSTLNSAGAFMRAMLGVHIARLREARAEQDRGASAVELAIITAVIITIAGIILLAVQQFVQKKSDQIGNG
jgi:UPF0716 family protein affecting phage T7 exclusion